MVLLEAVYVVHVVQGYVLSCKHALTLDTFVIRR
jgi:hypothetical protein